METLAAQPPEPNASGDDATASQDAGFNDLFVKRLEVRILGFSPSGGIDNLVFAIPEPGTFIIAILASAAIHCVYWRRNLDKKRRNDLAAS